jgi:hypothetical protein
MGIPSFGPIDQVSEGSDNEPCDGFTTKPSSRMVTS